ncbi:hypothetical protein HYH02_004362 [Chlamydomonas schloesseri]|uniref:Uncharacterized protein n=1 Tax=Chlamydomonas schloesseri TaxID=2026947 RepID=A0A835WNK1_9CHLO|nr:hypothetical protein HYH02_004362 [Chlamydomonas schloesseri]|eukprot:KAG2451094.1 hypothetical protein HYH02_004362 [Chlamydomonas schloesseri]
MPVHTTALAAGAVVTAAAVGIHLHSLYQSGVQSLEEEKQRKAQHAAVQQMEQWEAETAKLAEERRNREGSSTPGPSSTTLATLSHERLKLLLLEELEGLVSRLRVAGVGGGVIPIPVPGVEDAEGVAARVALLFGPDLFELLPPRLVGSLEGYGGTLAPLSYTAGEVVAGWLRDRGSADVSAGWGLAGPRGASPGAAAAVAAALPHLGWGVLDKLVALLVMAVDVATREGDGKPAAWSALLKCKPGQAKHLRRLIEAQLPGMRVHDRTTTEWVPRPGCAKQIAVMVALVHSGAISPEAYGEAMRRLEQVVLRGAPAGAAASKSGGGGGGGRGGKKKRNKHARAPVPAAATPTSGPDVCYLPPDKDGLVGLLVSFNRGPDVSFTFDPDELYVWVPFPKAQPSSTTTAAPAAGTAAVGGAQLLSAAAALCAELMRLRLMQAAADRLRAAMGGCNGAALEGSSWEHWAALGASQAPVVRVAEQQREWAAVTHSLTSGREGRRRAAVTAALKQRLMQVLPPPPLAPSGEAEVTQQAAEGGGGAGAGAAAAAAAARQKKAQQKALEAEVDAFVGDLMPLLGEAYRTTPLASAAAGRARPEEVADKAACRLPLLSEASKFYNYRPQQAAVKCELLQVRRDRELLVERQGEPPAWLKARVFVVLAAGLAVLMWGLQAFAWSLLHQTELGLPAAVLYRRAANTLLLLLLLPLRAAAAALPLPGWLAAAGAAAVHVLPQLGTAGLYLAMGTAAARAVATHRTLEWDWLTERANCLFNCTKVDLDALRSRTEAQRRRWAARVAAAAMHEARTRGYSTGEEVRAIMDSLAQRRGGGESNNKGGGGGGGGGSGVWDEPEVEVEVELPGSEEEVAAFLALPLDEDEDEDEDDDNDNDNDAEEEGQVAARRQHRERRQLEKARAPQVETLLRVALSACANTPTPAPAAAAAARVSAIPGGSGGSDAAVRPDQGQRPRREQQPPEPGRPKPPGWKQQRKEDKREQRRLTQEAPAAAAGGQEAAVAAAAASTSTSTSIIVTGSSHRASAAEVGRQAAAAAAAVVAREEAFHAWDRQRRRDRKKKGVRRRGTKAVSDMLKEEGWEPVRRRNHLVYRRVLSNGTTQTFTRSCTPSDWRTAANQLAALRRRNLEERLSQQINSTAAAIVALDGVMAEAAEAAEARRAEAAAEAAEAAAAAGAEPDGQLPGGGGGNGGGGSEAGALVPVAAAASGPGGGPAAAAGAAAAQGGLLPMQSELAARALLRAHEALFTLDMMGALGGDGGGGGWGPGSGDSEGGEGSEGEGDYPREGGFGGFGGHGQDADGDDGDSDGCVMAYEEEEVEEED